MRMWENKASSGKVKSQKGTQISPLHTEADDFYVFIYDEDEKM